MRLARSRALRAMVAAVLLAITAAGCRFIVPGEGDTPTLPEPGFSRGGFPSPSLEVPPPVY